METQWIFCPICKSKTRLKLRMDTVLKNYPLFCPKCKQESLIDAKSMVVSVIRTSTNMKSQNYKIDESNKGD